MLSVESVMKWMVAILVKTATVMKEWIELLVVPFWTPRHMGPNKSSIVVDTLFWDDQIWHSQTFISLNLFTHIGSPKYLTDHSEVRSLN